MSRKRLVNARRIIVKCGTSVISHSDGYIALGRVGNVVEQVAFLQRSGKEVILVTSGSVGIGKQRLRHQIMLSSSIRSHFHRATTGMQEIDIDPRCAAAAGQSGLMSLYETLFSQYDIAISQILVTDADFASEERTDNLRKTLNTLLSLGVLPVINENDVVSERKTPIRDENNAIFWDNDSLACLIGDTMSVNGIVLLSDVQGLYNKPPSDPSAEIIHTLKVDHEESRNSSAPNEKCNFTIGEKSRLGRGGMQAKLDAAFNAAKKGIPVLIASGYIPGIIRNIMNGEEVGTLITDREDDLSAGKLTESSRIQAIKARKESRKFQNLPFEQRKNVLLGIADALVERREEILKENEKDIILAQSTVDNPSVRARLVLTESKLQSLAEGLRAIANSKDPIGQLVKKTEVAEGLVLSKETCPIGVLLIIFESRPDVLPQVAGLCLFSGNGVIMKGGKEAIRTNTVLHKIICDQIVRATNGQVTGEIVGLVDSHESVEHLLKHDDLIDLCIPRGSSDLVKRIKSLTKIPVLGHSAGICHLYLDQDLNKEMAKQVTIDAKTDYPSACNAVETLLIHHSHISNGFAREIINNLRSAGVMVFGGPKIRAALSDIQLLEAPSFSHEYSDLKITCEEVQDVDEAIQHINKYSSSHTDSIITSNDANAKKFLDQVDSACVFRNASTRFADGYRFGLGAEIGISNGRIHARGPVGIEGLLTTKYKLISSNENGDSVAPFTAGHKKFVHKELAN